MDPEAVMNGVESVCSGTALYTVAVTNNTPNNLIIILLFFDYQFDLTYY